MRVDVTQDDIDKGRPLSHMSCPIAHALNRRLGTHDGRWAVGGVHANNTFAEIRLPIDAYRWLVDYDSGYDVEPFSFDVPDSWAGPGTETGFDGER